MTLFASDDFNRSNRNLLGDTASDGGTWEQWEAGDATDVNIVSNQCTTGDAGVHYLLHSGLADDDDFTVSCLCDPTGDKARFGLVVHAGLSGSSQKTGYMCWRDTSINKWQMYRFNGDGTSTRIYNDFVTTSLGDVQPALLEFDATVGALVMRFDGSPVTSTIPDATYVGGRAGMVWNGGSGATSGQVPAYFDDWQAETPTATPETPVSKSSTVSHESLQAAQAGAALQFEAKGVVSRVADAQIESLLRVASSMQLQWEAAQEVTGARVAQLEAGTSVANQSQAHLEGLGGLSAGRSVPFESSAAVAAQTLARIESLGFASVVAQAVVPMESRGWVSAASSAGIEVLQRAARAQAAVFESLQGVQSQILVELESLAGVFVDAVGHIEAIGRVSAQHLAQLENLTAVAGEAVLPIEALRTIAAMTGVPIEALQGASVNVVVDVVERVAYFALNVERDAQFADVVAREVTLR